MSGIPSVMSRALETTFQEVLTPALGISVRRTNEVIPAALANRLPAVIITAKKKEDWPAMRVSGRIGEVQELEFECRHTAPEGCEALGGLLVEAIGAASITSGWLFLQITGAGEKRDFESATRTLTLQFVAHCLTAPSS